MHNISVILYFEFIFQPLVFCMVPSVTMFRTTHNRITVHFNHWNSTDFGLRTAMLLYVRKNISNFWSHIIDKRIGKNVNNTISYNDGVPYTFYEIRLIDKAYDGFSLATNLINVRTDEWGKFLKCFLGLT